MAKAPELAEAHRRGFPEPISPKHTPGTSAFCWIPKFFPGLHAHENRIGMLTPRRAAKLTHPGRGVAAAKALMGKALSSPPAAGGWVTFGVHIRANSRARRSVDSWFQSASAHRRPQCMRPDPGQAGLCAWPAAPIDVECPVLTAQQFTFARPSKQLKARRVAPSSTAARKYHAAEPPARLS